MKKSLIFVLLLLLMHNGVYAQSQGQALIDSLLKVLPSEKEDSNKAKLLYDLSVGYMSVNPDEGIKYAQQCKELSERLGWKRGVSAGYNGLGLNYHNKADHTKELEFFTLAIKIDSETGNKEDIARETLGFGNAYGSLCVFPKALEYYNKAIALNEETGNKKMQGSTFVSTGNVYYVQGDYPKALDYYFKGLKINEEINNKRGIANSQFSVGNVYYGLNDYQAALEYYGKAQKTHEELGNKYGIAMSTQGIGNVYTQLKEYDKALQYDYMALKISQEMGIKYIQVACTGNIGDVYLKQKKYWRALAYGQQALKMAEEINDIHQYAWELAEIGHAYLGLAIDEPDKAGEVGELETDVSRHTFLVPGGKEARARIAIDYLNRALDSANKIHVPTVIMSCYQGLIAAYKLTGDSKKALDYADKYIALRDTIFSSDRSEQVTKAGMEYQYNQERLIAKIKAEDAKKEAAMKLARQLRYTWIGLAGAALLAGLLFLMYRNNKLLAKEQQKSEKLLLNILPFEVAEELKAKGSSTAKHFDNVTVLFTDFVNFTSAGERMTPTELIDELDTCFKTFDEITAAHKIEKIKTIGDAYLAVAGVPVRDDAHAVNVVGAAIAIRRFMDDRYALMGEKTFRVRIGIHSGSVVAGIVGVKKFAYDIWGDTVNTAARMESASEQGKINISQATYDLVKDKFKCTYRGELVAKNKGQLKMYFVEE